jgi:hypothetical protein
LGTDNDEDVYVGTKCKSDFSDINFTSDDGLTELDYWLQEKVDGDYAVFWVEVPSIPASPDTVSIYVYYRNNGATSKSNAKAAGWNGWGDDFGDGVRDSDLWDEFLTGTGVVGEANGTLYFQSYDVAAGGGYLSHSSVTVNNIEIIVNIHNLALHSVGFFINPNYSTSNHPEAYGEFYGIALQNLNDTCYVKRRVGTTKTTLYSAAWLAGTNTVKIRLENGTIRFFEGDTDRYSESYALATRAVYFYMVTQTTTGYTGSDWFDYFFVRKYVNPEPSHGSWGAEEERS